jgi:hypothetical protein
MVLVLGLGRGLGVRLGRGALLGAAVLPWLVLAPWLFGPRLLVPCDVLRGLPGAPALDAHDAPDAHHLLNDAVYQFLPWEIEVRRELREARLPLWSDRLDGGSSPWLNPQAGVLSFIAMLARPAPIEHWLLVSLLLKISVAFAGSFVLARSIGAARVPSMLVAGCYALGGAIMPWALFPHTRAAAWLPWLIAGAIRCARRPDPGRVAATAMITALMALAGHPEVAMAGGVLAVLCVAWLGRAGAWAGKDRPAPLKLARAAAGPAAGAALGLALSGCQLVPFVHAMVASDRAAEAEHRQVPKQEMSWLRPGSWFLGEGEGILLSPTNPDAYGSPYREAYDGPANWAESGAGYGGIVVLAGVAGLAVGGAGRRRLIPFAVVAGVYLLLAAWFLPALNLLIWMPFFRVLAYRRLLIISTLCLVVMAAFGLDLLLRSPRRATAASAVAIAAALSIAVAPGWRALAVWLLILSAVLGARRRTSLAVGALLVALVLDLVPWAWAMLPSGHRDLFFPEIQVVKGLESAAGEATTARVTVAGRTLPASVLAPYGLADIRPHNPMAPASHVRALRQSVGLGQRYFPLIERPWHPMIDFLNVKAVVTSADAAMGHRFQKVTVLEDGRLALWRGLDPLPRWFLTDQVDVVPSEEMKTWLDMMDDPIRVAVQPELASLLPRELVDEGETRDLADGSGMRDRARLLESRPGRVRLRVESPGAAVLATSLPCPEGWYASSGGRELPRLVINGGFFGTAVTRLDRAVELRFRPPGFLLGMALSALGLIAFTALVLARLRLGRRWWHRGDQNL